MNMGRITQEERKKYYANGRVHLLLELGGVCEDCGCDDLARLQFHHKGERTWVARKKSRWVRLALYRREAAAGLVIVLCDECNKTWGKPVHQCSEEPLLE